MSDYANVTVFITDANDNVPGKIGIYRLNRSFIYSFSVFSIGLFC
jgi:hypothetical protein